MSSGSKILITGAAGFIGSCLVAALNEQGYRNLVLVDNFEKSDKNRYLTDKAYDKEVSVGEFLNNPDPELNDCSFVFHLGGQTSYKSDFLNQNVAFPQRLFICCRDRDIPFVYASSSSVYGDGTHGYSDDDATTKKLDPDGAYGQSKLIFDKWMVEHGADAPWVGLRIFNVYGPNEYHKGMSASVAFKTFFEIQDKGKVSLFASSSPEYEDGGQLRDFIYVKDVVNVLIWLLRKWERTTSYFPTGIYNLGTGIGNSFNDVAKDVFRSMNLPVHILYRPIPENIRAKFRNEIIGDAQKLKRAGYTHEFTDLDTGIKDLVQEYLIPERYL